MTTVQAGVYYDHPGWFRLVFRYDPWLQEDLKNTVGFGNYKYDPKLKLWYVREPYKKTAVDLLKEHGYEVEFEGRERVKDSEEQKDQRNKRQVSGPRNNTINPWSVIFERIPDGPLRRKLYRSVALVLHPDKGGREEAMKELNEAWSKLKP